MLGQCAAILLWSGQCEAFVQTIIRLEVNMGRIGRRVHSWSAQPEHEAISLTLPGRASRRRVLRFILVLATLVTTSSSAVLADETADTLLQRALYFSDLYNWRAARPYFTRSQQMFEAAGDKRNALHARVGAIRAGADPTPIPELSYMLDQELAANPLLQSDKELRMFCLVVKGDFDGESDTPALPTMSCPRMRFPLPRMPGRLLSGRRQTWR